MFILDLKVVPSYFGGRTRVLKYTKVSMSSSVGNPEASKTRKSHAVYFQIPKTDLELGVYENLGSAG